MLDIKNNIENQPILNQIYDKLAELHNQGKKITLCKVSAHIVIKGNEEADKAAKQEIDMPGMVTTRGLQTSSSKGNEKTILQATLH